MKILIGETTYELVFRHDDGVCQALLTNPKDPAGFLIGIALCHQQDQYNRFVGRKVALKRLLQLNRIARSHRKQVWKQYWKQTNRASFAEAGND